MRLSPADLQKARSWGLAFIEGGKIVDHKGMPVNQGTSMFADLLWAAGAKLDGVTDDTAAWQAALDAVPVTSTNSKRWHLEVPDTWPDRTQPGGSRQVTSIKFNSGWTFDCSKILLNARGVRFDFSGMTVGTAITMTGRAAQATVAGNNMAGIMFADIYGCEDTVRDGKNSTRDGVLFTGNSDPEATLKFGSGQCGLHCCMVRGFRMGVTWHHRGYLSTLYACAVYNNLVGYFSKGGGTDAYENVGIVRGSCANNDVNVFMEAGYLQALGTSLDYAQFVQVAVRSGRFALVEGFMEYAIRSARYGTIGGIYSTAAPLTAIDLRPGNNGCTLRTDIGLNSTSASDPNYAEFVMRGGVWAVTIPAGSTGLYLRTFFNIDTGASARIDAPRVLWNRLAPASGYIANRHLTYNTEDTPTNYAGNLIWTPTDWDAGSDIPHCAHEQASTLSYMSANAPGMSISPAHNVFGSSHVGLASGNGFDLGISSQFQEDICITLDGTASGAALTNFQTGTNISFTKGAAGFNGSASCLEITKLTAAASGGVVGILIPIRANGQRPVIRGWLMKPATGGITGTFNINMTFVKPEFFMLGSGSSARPAFRPLVNSAKYAPNTASSGSSTGATNPTVIKFTANSAFVDAAGLTGDTWYPWQIGRQPDSNVPHWCTHVLLEFDLTAAGGSGKLNIDALDGQWL